MNSDIDVVIAWVDGTDKKWQKEKDKYSKNIHNNESANDARFRDWNHLKYVLRGIEKNMPWVHRIYLLTAHQIPKWLKNETGKLQLVFHEEFIPEKYLPTFSSHTIELNMHRIPGLSEKFIYFNDDTIPLRTMQPTDFFVNELPCDSAILNVHCPKKSLMIHTIAHNDAGVINEHFDMRKVIQERRSNWFSLKYGIKNNFLNLILSHCPRFPGFRQHHLPSAYLKSTFIEVWQEEFDYLDEVCTNKFRMKTDINQWVMREWQLAKNNFYPYSNFKTGRLIDFEKDEENKILEFCKKTIENEEIKMICINDGDTIEDYERLKLEVEKMLSEYLGEKSSFEK